MYIHQLRKKLGISKTAMAQSIGMCLQAYAKYEEKKESRYRREVGVTVALRVIEAHNVHAYIDAKKKCILFAEKSKSSV